MRPPPIFAAMVRWWTVMARAGDETSTSLPNDRNAVDPAVLPGVDHTHDAPRLLVSRMERLGLDPSDLGAADLALYGKLQARCSTCPDPQRCAAALQSDDDPAWQEWRDYCPNATVLAMLSTLRACTTSSRD